jgi:type 1 glutamine amidotransferase
VLRTLATAAALGAALIVVPSASGQSPDTTPPEITTSSTPTAPPQRNGNPPAAPSTSTGNGNWYIAGPVTTTATATDDVGVTRFEYSTDNGATWNAVPANGALPAAVNEGANNYRLRAFDAAGNVSHGNPSNTTLNQPAAAGATAVRLQSTRNRAVGDIIIFEPGTANEESMEIASISSPPSPNPNVTLSAPLAKAHDAASTVSTYAGYRTFSVNIDSQPPTATFPGVTDNHIGHSQIITPQRSDPSPGSGGTAVRDTWIDGVWTYPLPLDASQLSLGKHTWTVGVTDTAGNGNKVTQTFMVTTSFADIDAMLTRYATGGNIPSDTIDSLRSKLSAAKAANDAGDNATAAAQLDAFSAEANGIVVNNAARDLLVTDSQAVARQVRGIADPADPADLGVTSQVYPGQPRHLYVPPANPVHNPNATFKILVIANRPDGSYRHPAIEDAEVMLQQLGAQRGFDVDIWDAQYPTQSLPDTPFTSAANLAKYKVIVGDSSVGNNTFDDAYEMKDGTVVNEQTAFQQYIENGGGYVALHGADDSMHNWQWYKDMMGGLFQSHPSNANAFGTDCGTCYWAELITEDPSHPATNGSNKPIRVPIADELYHFDRKPRPFVHPLMLLNEDTYKTGIGVNSNGSLENGDHPISWCGNYDGGREFTQVLGHNWELFDSTPWFRESIYQGILTAGGFKYANCVTHIEVKRLISSLAASGGITADAATAATDAVQAAYDKYATLTTAGYGSSIADIKAFRAVAENPASGDAASRAQLLFKAQELQNWMQVLLGSQDVGGGVAGNVPATLSLGLGPAASFGAFTPGAAKTYTASTTANVISTAGDATLSVADPSSTATGRLVNGSFSLVNPVQAAATSALGAGQALADVGGSSAPTSLLTYSGPVSNDAVTLNFSQAIGANDPLRTGSYSKTLTFTLSTTTP